MSVRPFLLTAAFFLIGLYCTERFGTVPWLCGLTAEDQLAENLEAILCLIASVLFFVKYRRGKEGCDLFVFKTHRNLFFLIMAIGLFFVFAEEISWGQRIFHLRSPEIFFNNNRQQEINIHNLRVFHESRFLNLNDALFPALLLFFFLAVPVLNKVFSGFSFFIKRINFPIVPIPLGSLFGVIFWKFWVLKEAPAWCMQKIFSESSELEAYFLTMLVAAWFLFADRGVEKGTSGGAFCDHPPER